MTLLRICWAIDNITLLVGLYVFVKGILTEAPKYDFYLLGLALMGLLVGSLVGSYWLLNQHHLKWAILVAAVPAVLATLVGLGMLLLGLLYQPGGNTK
ncbi:hypothetical protein GO755_36960 [Spirosoma sp. HMF4905]|uniref:Osmoprotectant transporter permease n=1 Tax=Spirosoma arboris TaxID=2682092 RepID=A0A7K1SPD4_9BACT|nr:hypothetical protein [Spirosoma arboris]MVM35665.1 hypothetical protein [Spirosoma arboris]